MFYRIGYKMLKVLGQIELAVYFSVIRSIGDSSRIDIVTLLA